MVTMSQIWHAIRPFLDSFCTLDCANQQRHPLLLMLVVTLISTNLMVPSTTLATTDDVEVIRLNNDGVEALKVSNYDLGMECFKKALTIDPYYQLAHDNLAILHNQYGIRLQGTPAEAIKHFHKSLLLSGVTPYAPIARASLEKALRKLGHDPANLNDRLTLAESAREKGDNIDAAVEYSEALKLHEDTDVQAKLQAVLHNVDKLYYRRCDSAEPTTSLPPR